LKFVGFFWIFSPNGKKLVFSLNDQIRIEIVKFSFKRTNQKSSCHYRPPAPTTDYSAGTTTQPGSSAGGSAHPLQVLAAASAPAATSSMTSGSASPSDSSA
jgi:hypothetical protein